MAYEIIEKLRALSKNHQMIFDNKTLSLLFITGNMRFAVDQRRSRIAPSRCDYTTIASQQKGGMKKYK